MFLIPSAFAVDVNDLVILTKHVLTGSGYSQDLVLNPVDGTLHIAWVNSSGDIQYAVRYPDDTWSNTQTIPDKGIFVVGIEEPATNPYPRKCIGISIDDQGLTHLIFTDSDGDIYYLNGRPGSWSTPVLIVDKVNPSIWLDIVVINGVRVMTWEDEGTGRVFTVMYRQGQWGSVENMGGGENPSLCTGSENRIYLICREYGDPYNVKLWYLTVGDATWHFISPVTNASVRLGHGPQMAVYNKKMVISWSNSNRFTTEKDKKGELFVAASVEPGLVWIPRLGGVEPLYYDNTADTHGRVAIYSDGAVLHMNGGRNERFQIWDGTSWSITRRAPWGDEDTFSEKIELEVVCDGKNAWIASSLANSNNGEVALYGIQNPEGELVNVPEENPGACEPVPEPFHFYPIAPNPFNPSTSIIYDVPRTVKVQISIYDVCGRRLALLTDEEKQAGHYSIVWNGTDGFGRGIPSGIYIIMMQAGDFRSQQKALFMK